jgi:starvation-inducible DNA-binding protein
MNNTDHHPILHDIPPEIRLYLTHLLNQTLACTVDLRSQVKQACWNVKGRDFPALRALFATLATELDGYTDLVAERIAALGGMALGTARVAATQSQVLEYPDATVDGDAHVLALTERLAYYAMALRSAMVLAADVEDAGSAAVYTDISRGVDKQLWFLQAYLHH